MREIRGLGKVCQYDDAEQTLEESVNHFLRLFGKSLDNVKYIVADIDYEFSITITNFPDVKDNE